MTAFQRILINTERCNETVVTPSLAKPHELICTPNKWFLVPHNLLHCPMTALSTCDFMINKRKQLWYNWKYNANEISLKPMYRSLYDPRLTAPKFRGIIKSTLKDGTTFEKAQQVSRRTRKLTQKELADITNLLQGTFWSRLYAIINSKWHNYIIKFTRWLL